MYSSTTPRAERTNPSRVSWRISDVLPEGAKLDFTRKFLPEALVGADALEFLSEAERLFLNQIRGSSYLHLFGLLEEFLVRMVVRHVGTAAFGDRAALGALLRLAEEEVEHRDLFRRLGGVFAKGFGSPCATAGSADDLATLIMRKSPMAVLLMTLHIELLAQRHFLESVRDHRAENLDPLFRSLLRHHWLDEAQHVRIDELELKKWTRTSSPSVRTRAVAEYFEMLRAFDVLIQEQLRLDLQSLLARTGRILTDNERATFIELQHGSCRDAFMVIGMAESLLSDVLRELWAESALEVDELPPAIPNFVEIRP